METKEIVKPKSANDSRTYGAISFQAQVGDIQQGTIVGYDQIVFINGQVASIDLNGFFETILVFTEQDLQTYDLSTDQGKDRFEWDAAVRATGSAQIVHQTITKIGQLSDGRVFFLLRGNVLALPHEKVTDQIKQALQGQA